MDNDKVVRGKAPANWAYPLLRMFVVGAILEITCVSLMTVFLRIGLVPKVLEPVVHYFIVGAAITGCWAVCSILLYLWIQPGLRDDSDS